MKPLHAALLSAVACLAIVSACSPVGGYCAAAAECDDFEAAILGFDQVGESNDSDEVCVVNNQGLLRALRANEEESCLEEADATERYFACVADTYARDEKDACDGFLLDDRRNPCSSELDDVIDLRIDNGNDCSASET